jgi:ribonuclease BN (tRNA processing enzyme)
MIARREFIAGLGSAARPPRAEKKVQRLTSLALCIGTLLVASVHQVMGQTAGAPAKPPTRVITLGTVAGPPPRPHRAQSSNLLIVNGTLYVVDAGDGAARRITKAGFNVRDVGTIFITHHHDDHTAGVGTLMSTAWDNQRTAPIHVYGPPRTEELIKAAVQYFSISADIRIADGGRTIPISRLFFGHDVGAGEIYKDANVTVRAIENTHFDFQKISDSARQKSYSYRFDTPGRVVVFTGDTGLSEGLTELAKGADLLVSEANSIEQRMEDLLRSGQWQVMTPQERDRIKQQMAAGHLSTEDVGKLATRAQVNTVVLTHLTYKDNDDYSSWVAEVQKHFSGPVLVAKDLNEF